MNQSGKLRQPEQSRNPLLALCEELSSERPAASAVTISPSTSAPGAKASPAHISSGNDVAEVFEAPAEEVHCSVRRSPGQAARSVEFRFVAPVISPWETRFQPREHRRRHTTKHAGRGYPTGSPSETLGEH